MWFWLALGSAVLGLGYLFLKDKPTKFTWIASIVMIAGVILIKIG